MHRAKNTQLRLGMATFTNPMSREPTMQTPQQKLWIHGGVDANNESEEEEERNKLCKINVPIQIYTYLDTIDDIEVDEDYGTHIN